MENTEENGPQYIANVLHVVAKFAHNDDAEVVDALVRAVERHMDKFGDLDVIYTLRALAVAAGCLSSSLGSLLTQTLRVPLQHNRIVFAGPPPHRLKFNGTEIADHDSCSSQAPPSLHHASTHRDTQIISSLLDLVVSRMDGLDAQGLLAPTLSAVAKTPSRLI